VSMVIAWPLIVHAKGPIWTSLGMFGPSPNTMHLHMHGLPQSIKQCVLGIITKANKPFISFTPRDGCVIRLPHWMHKLHEDCTFPLLLENGYGTCHMSNMFKGKVGWWRV
jgi:hypothetical protein